MKELVYAGKAAKNLIKSLWPQATFEDASDYIHPERFEVDIPEVGEDEFYPKIIKAGLAKTCFSLGLSLGIPEHHDRIRKWIEAAKAQGCQL